MSDKKKPMEKKVIEPTIKSVTNCVTCGSECDVNTDGTTHYYVSKTERFKTELKEAVELIELYIEKSTHRENGMIYINDFELFEKFNTFLTKHKSKE